MASKNKCEFCGKCFSSPQNLITHKKTARYCLELRESDITEYTCDYCGTVLLHKKSLVRHHKSCLEYKDYLIASLEKKLLEKDAKIAELQSKLSYKEGEVVGMEKSIKPPKIVVNNKIINKKLASVQTSHIQPLTLEYVKSRVDEYDYEAYKRGKKGVRQYIENLIILEMDGVVHQNYACTDRSRNAFHRLVNDNEWKTDGGARFINNILNSLAERAKIHDQSLQNEIKMLGGAGRKTDSLMRLDTELLPIYGGIVNPKSKERIELFESIRNEIRDICSVQTDM